MNSKVNAYLMGSLSGLMLGMAFPPFTIPGLAFVAFVPLIFSIEYKKGQKIFWLFYLTFFLFNLISQWWVGSWQPNADPFLVASGVALVIFHPFFFMIPIYAYLSIRRNFGLNTALWTFPFIWTTFEWLHSLGELAYPWLTLGNSQIYNNLWIQFADITGIFGVTFLIALINSLIARSIFIYLNNNKVITDYKNKFNSGFNVANIKPAKKLIVTILILIIIPYAYGILRIRSFEHNNLLKNNKTINIALVQPAINPWAKWEGGVIAQIDKHIELQDSLLNHHKNIDLFIWSETAIPYYDLNMNSSHNFGIIKTWVEKNQISILSGFADIYIYNKDDEIPKAAKLFPGTDSIFYDSYNAALLLSPSAFDNSAIQVYRKIRLTPFSERIPYLEHFPFTAEWLQWGVGISSWAKGKIQEPFTLKIANDSVRIGLINCIESIYPDFSRVYIDKNAEILVVITNDAWFDHTFGPEQHFAIAQVRAIETRRYIARCANSGLSGFISPSGDRIKILEQYRSIAGMAEIPLLNEKSFYAMTGDWLPLFSAIISLSFIIIGFFRNRSLNSDKNYSKSGIH